ncbi:hypothetical protein P9112_007721 [Eukaryota sp. TZLM1-RC]
MPSYRKRRPKSAPSHRPARPKPSWDSTINDLSVLKATPEELVRRKRERTSPNLLTRRTPPPSSPPSAFKPIPPKESARYSSLLDRTEPPQPSSSSITNLVQRITHDSRSKNESHHRSTSPVPTQPPPSPSPSSSSSSCSCCNEIEVVKEELQKEFSQQFGQLKQMFLEQIQALRTEELSKVQGRVDALENMVSELKSENQGLKEKIKEFNLFVAYSPKLKKEEEIKQKLTEIQDIREEQKEQIKQPAKAIETSQVEEEQEEESDQKSEKEVKNAETFQDLESLEQELSLIEQSEPLPLPSTSIQAPTPKPKIPSLEFLESQSLMTSSWVSNRPQSTDRESKVSNYPVSIMESSQSKPKSTRNQSKIIRTKKVPVINCLNK